MLKICYRNPYSLFLFFSKPRVPFRCSVHGIPNIPTPDRDPQEADFEKEPPPASPLLVSARIVRVGLGPVAPVACAAGAAAAALGRRRACGLLLPYVHVVRVDGDDVVVVGEFARVGAESQVGGLGQFEGLGLEALGPFVLGFVLELDFEGGVLIVCHSYLSGYFVVSSDSTSLIFFSLLVSGLVDAADARVHTEHPASSLSFPSCSESYDTELFPSMAIT